LKAYRAKFTLPDGGVSYSELWAESDSAAQRIAADRGMHQGVKRARQGTGKEFRPSRLAKLPGGWARYDVLHSLCYLSFLAGRHGVTDVTGVVGDDSPLHELAHYLGAGPNIRGGKMLEHLESRVAWLEGVIPGMPPEDCVLVLPDA